MNKEQRGNREAKKKPARTVKEKRAAKRTKNEYKGGLTDLKI